MQWVKIGIGMNNLTKTMVTLCLGLSLANVAGANPNQGADAKKYFKGKDVIIYNVQYDVRGDTWFATPHKVMSFNKKTKKPDIISVLVEGRGYAAEFEGMVVVNCAQPTASYIDRGKNGKISFKDSMAIETYPNDANHIPRGAVEGLFKRYCK